MFPIRWIAGFFPRLLEGREFERLDVETTGKVPRFDDIRGIGHGRLPTEQELDHLINQVRIEKGAICGDPDNNIGWKLPRGLIVAGEDILLRSS